MFRLVRLGACTSHWGATVPPAQKASLLNHLAPNCAAQPTHLAEMKSRMFCVEPTTPMPRCRLASMARLNISPGTSK